MPTYLEIVVATLFMWSFQFRCSSIITPIITRWSSWLNSSALIDVDAPGCGMSVV